ncbi:hypothetical protein PIB30_105126, partial [Stylosanthes scabra]|nr:hypothetical protein [Stylosanthes scabra]
TFAGGSLGVRKDFRHHCTPTKNIEKEENKQKYENRTLVQSHALTARPRGLKIQFWKAPATIALSCVLCCTFARITQPRGTLALPRGDMGCSRTKFGLASRRRVFLFASLRVPRARMSCSRDKSLQLACTCAPQLVQSHEPKNMDYGPPIRARDA